MATIEDRQDRMKNFALAKAGAMVNFIEGNVAGGEVRIGRVVGYYYGMSQLIVEVDFQPKYAISMPYTHVTEVAKVDRTKMHTMVGWEELTGGSVKDPKHPHACPRCQFPALRLFSTIECSNPSCPCYKRP